MNKSSSRNSRSSGNLDFPQSPTRSETPYASPLASLESPPLPESSKAIVVVDNYTQCSPSPLRQSAQRESRNPAAGAGNVRDTAWKAVSVSVEGEDGKSAVEAILRRSRTRDTMKRAALWARVLEAAICTSSFAVMAADKTQGWSGDSFDRYREYRYK